MSSSSIGSPLARGDAADRPFRFRPAEPRLLGLDRLTTPFLLGGRVPRLDDELLLQLAGRPVHSAGTDFLAIAELGGERLEEQGLLRRRDRRALPRPPPFKSGDRIVVTKGPFQGLQGLHSGLSASQREIVLLAFLGGQRRVVVPAGSIAPC
jgi:hypothetical protein